MLKARVLYGLMSCISILQTGCLSSPVKNDDSVPSKITDLKVTPVGCGDDPLDFYNAMPVLSDVEPPQNEIQDLQAQKIHQDCSKLRKAIKLSIPGSEIQNDEKALVLLNELKLNSTLVGRDRKFSLLLLQHVSQRQQLRKLLAAQEKRRIKADEKNRILKSQLEILQSQLDQLKKIEIEIDKKERSVISPIVE
jgi:hypothetical protein